MTSQWSLIMGNDVARRAYYEITMGNDIVMDIHCDVTMSNEVLSKLLERHIHISFYNFLKSNNLLHLAQSGFIHLFSCETALYKHSQQMD